MAGVPTAGKLRSYVRLVRLVSVPNLVSGLDQQAVGELRRWASIEQVSSGVYLAAKQVGEAVTHWIVMHRDSVTEPHLLTAEWVIEHAGRQYRVIRARLHPQSDRFVAVEATDLGAVP